MIRCSLAASWACKKRNIRCCSVVGPQGFEPWTDGLKVSWYLYALLYSQHSNPAILNLNWAFWSPFGDEFANYPLHLLTD